MHLQKPLAFPFLLHESPCPSSNLMLLLQIGILSSSQNQSHSQISHRYAAQLLVHVLATSKLDYCNSLLYGLPKYPINQLQRVQNAVARVVTVSPKSCHITPVLKNLHWLPIDLRIEFKILIITYKALHGLAPTYVKDLLKNYHPPRDLRSVFKEESTRGPCV